MHVHTFLLNIVLHDEAPICRLTLCKQRPAATRSNVHS